MNNVENNWNEKTGKNFAKDIYGPLCDLTDKKGDDPRFEGVCEKANDIITNYLALQYEWAEWTMEDFYKASMKAALLMDMAEKMENK